MKKSRILTAGTVAALVIALVSVSFTGTAIAATARGAKPVAVASASAKPSLANPRPTISMGPNRVNGEGPGERQGRFDDEASAEDIARHAAMQKFQDCLTAQGVTLPQGPGFGRDRGTAPGANPQASMTDKQKAAYAACQQYAPQFGPRDGFNGQRPSGGPTGAPNPRPTSKLSLAPSAKPKVAPNAIKPTAMASAKTAAYIACLNNAGIAVKTLADINSLDRGSAKVAAALKACAGKTPFNK